MVTRTQAVVAPWGESSPWCQVSPRLTGEQTATASRDTRPPWVYSRTDVPHSRRPAGSLKVPAGSEDPRPIYRQINSQIPLPPDCLKPKIQFTEVRLTLFRENICCVMWPCWPPRSHKPFSKFSLVFQRPSGSLCPPPPPQPCLPLLQLHPRPPPASFSCSHPSRTVLHALSCSAFPPSSATHTQFLLLLLSSPSPPPGSPP